MRSRGGLKDHGGTTGTSRMVCCLLVVLACFLCLQQLCYFWGSDPKIFITMEAVEKNKNSTEPQALLYPVWWYAPFFTGSGYGTEAISYVVSLVQTRLIRRQDIWLTHSGDAVHEGILNTMEPGVRDVLKSQEHNNLRKSGLPEEELDRPAIVICHSFPECWRLPTDGEEMESPGCPCPDPTSDEQVAYRVGRTMFETATLPAHLVEHCNAMDEVWVPTEFNRETFKRSGVHSEKLRVVPQGIDTDFFDPVKYEPLSLRSIGAEQATGPRSAPNDTYVFLSIFKWEARKGWDVLLEAFLSEFTAQDNVELHILTHPFITDRRDFSAQIRTWVKKKFNLSSNQDFERMGRVFVYHKHISDDLYPRIYKSANSVVLPTRGEGWGRPQMEAMAMGIPVITTNWSGPTAFMNEDVGYPLAIDGLVDIVADGPHFFSYFVGSQWAQPSATHLRHLMRKVYSEPEAAAAKGMAGRKHIQQHFTPEVIALSVMKEIRRIEQKLGGIIVKVVRPRLTKIAKSLCISYPQLCVQDGQQQQQQQQQEGEKGKQREDSSRAQAAAIAASAAEALKQRPLCLSYPQLCQYKQKGSKAAGGS